MIVTPRSPSQHAVRRSAFTLLEILIVVAILVVLAGASSVYVFRYLEDAKESRVVSDVQAITTAAQGYKTKYSDLPQSLQTLVQPPDGGQPYMEASGILDPWGKEYLYDASGQNNGGLKPDVWTTTPSGRKIGNWPNGN